MGLGCNNIEIVVPSLLCLQLELYTKGNGLYAATHNFFACKSYGTKISILLQPNQPQLNILSQSNQPQLNIFSQPNQPQLNILSQPNQLHLQILHSTLHTPHSTLHTP